MTSLITTLNRLADKTPDEIAASLNDPFSKWRHGATLTQEEYDEYRETPIVIAHRTQGEQPWLCEVRHKIGASQSEGYTQWSYSHWRGWLGHDYWFRSLVSYRANQNEGFDGDIYEPEDDGDDYDWDIDDAE
jgi:hypothetical protein